MTASATCSARCQSQPARDHEVGMTNGTRPLLCERFFCFRGRSPPLSFRILISGSWADLRLLHPTLNNVAKMPGRTLLLSIWQRFFYGWWGKKKWKMPSRFEVAERTKKGASHECGQKHCPSEASETIPLYSHKGYPDHVSYHRSPQRGAKPAR